MTDTFVGRSLYDLGRPELVDLMTSLGQPSYRADQVWRWLYAGLAVGFGEMTDLPLGLRDALETQFVLHTLAPITQTTGDDDLAVKHLFRLSDGQFIESVLMHYLDPADMVHPVDESGPLPHRTTENGGAASTRHTACLSTQVGCAMGCVFCATGQMGLVRDLTRGECVEQAVLIARRLRVTDERLSNVVFMGMGEPLANWPATWGTIRTLVDPTGFGMSPRRLTISTVGIPSGIRRLARKEMPIRLAVSLHAADDALRSDLVPVNATFPLAEILDACKEYQQRRKRRITIEYVLIDGVNDRADQARRLAGLLVGLKVLVNLIPLNPTDGSDMGPSTPEAATRFMNVLEAARIRCTLRSRRGIEVQAGCGQLRSRAAEGRLGRSLQGPASTSLGDN